MAVDAARRGCLEALRGEQSYKITRWYSSSSGLSSARFKCWRASATAAYKDAAAAVVVVTSSGIERQRRVSAHGLMRNAGCVYTALALLPPQGSKAYPAKPEEKGATHTQKKQRARARTPTQREPVLLLRNG